jgi:CRISPR-associated endonuclease/helicase Cas3
MAFDVARYKAFFEQVTGFPPYQYQVEAAQAILSGKNVLIRAPTGTGKSEAILLPFLLGRAADLPPHLVYILPMRTLVESLAERFSRYAESPEIKHPISIAGHHGKRRESVFFNEDVVVTTIDQAVGAYCCTPLSLPARYGNIPAGTVASAFLVFDEIHTLEPIFGFQAALILAEQTDEVKMPFALVSATLPQAFLEWTQTRFQAQVFKPDEEDIQVRKDRHVMLHTHLSDKDYLGPQQILDNLDESNARVIAVCNTVSRAQHLYHELLKFKPKQRLYLIHSRFLPQDRSRIQEELTRAFGKQRGGQAILVATQAIEVGLDISSDVLLTEVSPIDSLIQRAGRCARWGGPGHIHIYNVKQDAPYSSLSPIMRETRQSVQKCDGAQLNWELECALVDRILGPLYEREYMSVHHRAAILQKLAGAAYRGSRSAVSQAVRGADLSCEVSVLEDHEYRNASYRILSAPRVRVPQGVLKNSLTADTTLYEVEVDVHPDRTNDEGPTVAFRNVRPKEVTPGGFYILSTTDGGYDSESGLIIGQPGKPMVFDYSDKKIGSYKQDTYSSKYEPWIDHAQRIVEMFRTLFLPSYSYVLHRLADAWQIAYEQFISELERTLALHDLGKLNIAWQKAVGTDQQAEPVAHTEFRKGNHPPAHSTVSAYALWQYLDELQPCGFGRALALAVAHHHSVRASRVPEYKIPQAYQNLVNSVAGEGMFAECLTEQQGVGSTTLNTKLPDPVDYVQYRTYVVVARLLRLSDLIASGGEDAVQNLEKRLRGI